MPSSATGRCCAALLAACLALLLPVPYMAAQTPAPADDQLEAVLVLARHGVRTPIESETRGGAYNAQPWPLWPVAPGMLTPHGATALRLLGAYYRGRYAELLDADTCAASIFAEANTTQRTLASADAMLSGIAPGCTPSVHTTPGRNLLFGPGLGANLALIEAATFGRFGDEPDWFTHAFAVPLAATHRILEGCDREPCTGPKPDFRIKDAEHGSVHPRDPRTASPVTAGADFAENFLLEYTEGLPMKQVGWGRVSRTELNSLMEMNTRYHDFVLRTPAGAQAAASDLAAHIRDTLLAAATGRKQPYGLGDPRDRFFLLDGHDANLTWLGGLLRLDWLLPDGAFNATPPGSALVFELHRSRSTDEQTVRVLFISQTLDQIRDLRPLVGLEQPSIAPVFVPGCSRATPHYACSAQEFAHIMSYAIDPRFVSDSPR